MFLSDFSIRHPIAVLAIIVALMCTGLFALANLKVNPSPDVQEPVIVVDIVYPGASAETVEREVINRVERSLQSITGVYQIRSTANEGSAQIELVFNFKKNMLEAPEQIRNAIASVRFNLPAEMREPTLQRVDISADPVMEIALSSTSLSHIEASRLLNDVLADRFRAIEGVAVVEVNGALKRELSVLLNSEKLSEFGVSAIEVVNALKNQNTSAPVGKISGVLDEQSIRFSGKIDTPAEFGDIVVKGLGDKTVHLGQLATSVDGYAELASYSMRDGRDNVGLSVTRAHDASTVAVANKLRELVNEINGELPAGSRLEITRDGGKDAQENLNNVIDALVFGAGLTVLVVYVFLNSWRSTLITALSLPTSVIASFIAVWLCGFTLNFMTLLGLSLAIGVLIDDAIVVRENIVRHMERGADRRTAASIGTREIGLAVTATTLSIIAVFIPVAFMPGVSGEWFRPFALTVASSVIVSLFISFTLDPMLSAYWGDPAGHQQQSRRGISLALEKFNSWFDQQADRYSEVIAWALKHRKPMTLLVVVCFAGAISLQVCFGGSEFQPKLDDGVIIVQLRTPSGSSIHYSRLKVEHVIELARTLPETISIDSNVTPFGGRVFVNVGKSTARKRSASDIAADLRKLMGRLIGADYVVMDDSSNGDRKPVQIQFFGPDSRQLSKITNDFMEKLARAPGAVDVGLSEQDPKSEVKIDLNRGLANSMGISANDIAQTLRIAFAGVDVGDWVDPTGESRNVAVRLRPEDRTRVENIERLPISVNNSDRMIPLEQIATLSMGKGPSQIQHENGKRMIAVSANAEGRSAGEVTASAMDIAKAINFPPGYGIELGGASGAQQEVFGQMAMSLLIGIGLMYLVLVIQFGSFTVPLPVILSLPLSLIGVIVSLLLTRGTLNLMSIIGIVMLMGLVAKNAILLLDCTRKREAEGYRRKEALMYAGRQRLRPILMTTLALVAGMVPVAIGIGEGSEFYRPMAVAIIGGTITSTVLTLLMVPIFFDSIELFCEGATADFHRRATHWNPFVAGLLATLEIIATLLLIRFAARTMTGAMLRR